MPVASPTKASHDAAIAIGSRQSATAIIHRRVVIWLWRMAEFSVRRMIEAARPGVEEATGVMPSRSWTRAITRRNRQPSWCHLRAGGRRGSWARRYQARVSVLPKAAVNPPACLGSTTKVPSSFLVMKQRCFDRSPITRTS